MGRKPFIKEISKEDLIEDAKKIYEIERKKDPKFELFRDDYTKYSKYTRSQLSKHFGSWKIFINLIESFFKPKREDIIEDAIKIFISEKEKNKNFILKRDFYLKKSNFTKIQLETEFGTFTEFLDVVKEEMGIKDEESLTRDSFNIVKDESSKGNRRRYVVSCVIAGAEISMPFLKSIKNYCKVNKAELVLLTMRGVKINDIFLPHVLKEIENYLCTEIKFNSNLKAVDFKLSPSMIMPLTGLARYGNKETSLIVAAPKLFMLPNPVANKILPHVSYTTGTISTPEYSNDRIGMIASQDNTLGGLVVEIENDKLFHIRMIEADKNYGFYDLDKYYIQDKIKLIEKNKSVFDMGDAHLGFEEKFVMKNWWEIIEIVKPKCIVWHDLLEARSISHHIDHNMKEKVNRPEHVKTLKLELEYIGNELKRWREKFPNIEFAIVRSNHDEFLDRYLTEGRYVDDVQNHVIALELAQYLIRDNLNPLQMYIEKYFKIRNVRWLSRDEDYKEHEYQLASHGDKGSSGSRGTTANMELSYNKCISGHSHSPKRIRNSITVGTTCQLRMNYNVGPSNWIHSSAILYPNGTVTLINSIENKWKI